MVITPIITLRANQLKKMDQVLYTSNNLDLLAEWCAVCVPNCATKTDYLAIASCEDEFAECVRVFKKIVNNDDFYMN